MRPVTNLRFTQSFVEALGPGRVEAVGGRARLADCEWGPGPRAHAGAAAVGVAVHRRRRRLRRPAAGPAPSGRGGAGPVSACGRG